MIVSLIFGDLFEYNNKTFIFLAKTESVLYAAEILNFDLSRRIDSLCQAAIAKNKQISRNILYCYVKLQTEELEERLAFLGGAGKDKNIGYNSFFRKLSIVLRREDLEQIYKEIVRAESPLPIELKELIKELSI